MRSCPAPVDWSRVAPDLNYMDARVGRYAIDFTRMPDSIAALTKDLLEIEATGDRARAEWWFGRNDKMPAELRSAPDAAKDVPVDVYPGIAFPEGVQ